MCFILPLPGVDDSPGSTLPPAASLNGSAPFKAPEVKPVNFLILPFLPLPVYHSSSDLPPGCSLFLSYLFLVLFLSPQSYDLLSQEEISLSKNISFIYQDIDYRAVCRLCV